MECPRCHAKNPSGMKFCGQCASPLGGGCPSCGAPNPPGNKFCGQCAAPLDVAGVTIASNHETSDAERRQLTVLFCDLVDSTVLASRLDPEELRDVVRAYQEACGKVIARFDGHIAQYLGDGLLVYFGYPLAHEDDAERAVRAGLGILDAIGQLSERLSRERSVQVRVRLGIHTGLVVVGHVGEGARQEQLALGETPNVAARLQAIAPPNALVISAGTLQLLRGFFACERLTMPPLKGLAQPIEVYRVLYESTARSRFDALTGAEPTPLVGREREVTLLRERWEQVKDGSGHVILLSGEAGIGKSRLVRVLMEHVATDQQAWLTPCRCSPYYQNSVMYPIVDLLERVVLRFEREDSAQQKLAKLEGLLVQYGLPLAEGVPLFATLLSLSLGTAYAALNVPAEQQKTKTLQAFLTMLLKIAAQQPLLFVMEDLHWADPSTLEFLSLLIDQGPTARILTLATFRPDFNPPWTGRSHVTHLTLHRLPHRQVAEMTGRLTRSKALPPAVLEQIVAKTDGVPLFVEELTKMVLESDLLQERDDRFELRGPLPALAIPATLHDSLMARLDRLATVKSVAQLAATLGRQFSYELLHAVSPLDEATLRRGLQQLVNGEFLYQRGVPPEATYLFKHALIQDAAYESLLRSTRQRHHQRVAQVLEARFPEICETQPEFLAHHYTEADLAEEAVVYWRRAGERAIQRSANLEAISHFTSALEALKSLPDSVEGVQHELLAQTGLGHALSATRGYAAQDVERAFARAHALCQRAGETVQAPVLFGLWFFYHVRAAFNQALELAEQLLTLARREQDRYLEVHAHWALGGDLFHLGELQRAQAHLDEGSALYGVLSDRSNPDRFPQDPGVTCRGYVRPLWLLGYPDQAIQRGREAIALARSLSHPFSLAFALNWTATVHQFRGEAAAAQEHSEALIGLAEEQGFAVWVAFGGVLRGWALVEQGRREEGVRALRAGMEAWRATGAEVDRPYFLALLAEVSATGGEVDEGLGMLAEALEIAHRYGDVYWEPEIHRLKGQLLLQRSAAAVAEAEACYRQALHVARHQQARSLELRAAMSLGRLWTARGEREQAQSLLAEIYAKFTEGFETPDLVNASALLAELSGSDSAPDAHGAPSS
jgi:TOMM system kinase/cyclase fusion protein